MDRLRRALGARVDPASFVAFRVGFGLLATFAAVRFVSRGWIQELLVQPTFHFAWIPGLPVPSFSGLYALLAAQALAGIAIALSLWPRVALAVWLFSFGWIELIDKALYLNHYVLFTILGATLLATPVHRVALHDGSTLPAWVPWLFRAELGLVYLWAGLAKLNADWLFAAQPLSTWLKSRGDLPVVGPLFELPATAYAMSWAGAAYDLAVPFLLLGRRTRMLGLSLVVFFHTAVGLLFPLGVFPLLMILGATLFLAPSWPRRFSGGSVSLAGGRPLSRPATALWLGVVFTLALVPARFLLFGTDPSWTERGHRFAWRVLLNEKTGLVDYRVVERATGRTWRVMPSGELTPIQHEQMRTQPDMIRDYALHLRDVHAAAGRDVAVYADAWASLNGRPPQRLIRPDLDLVRPLPELESEGWIVPLAR